MINSNLVNLYKRHLQFVCGYDTEDLDNLSDEEIKKLFLKHS